MAKVDTENTPEGYVVSLHLTSYEANVLYHVSRHIGGPIRGARGVFSGPSDSIENILEDANIYLIKTSCVPPYTGGGTQTLLLEEFECFEKLNKV